LAFVEARSQVLFISEAVRRKLGLKVLGERKIRMANGAHKTCSFTDLVEVHGKTCHTFMPALVFPGVNEVLLVTAPREGILMIANKRPVTRKRHAPFFRR
jgi:hypothetical protein